LFVFSQYIEWSPDNRLYSMFPLSV